MRYAHLAPERMRDAVDVLEKRDVPRPESATTFSSESSEGAASSCRFDESRENERRPKLGRGSESQRERFSRSHRVE
jgi:hypothetical protein